MSERKRLTVNEGAELVTRDGAVVGRIVSMTLDCQVGEGGTTGGVGSTSGTSPVEKEETSSKEGGVGETTAAVNRCWDYWIEITGKRQRLDAKRKRFIRSAVELVGEAAVKEALLGLSLSPWHNGQNPDRKPYLEIRYALKGIGDESDDERIEKARLWAQVYAPGFQTFTDEAKVQRWLSDVQYTLSLPHRPERDRATQAFRKLKDAGFKIVPLDESPWARLTRER